MRLSNTKSIILLAGAALISVSACHSVTVGETSSQTSSPTKVTDAAQTVLTDTSFSAKGNSWQIVWSDSFDGSQLDRSKWSPEISCWGGGNNERQCYVDRPENIEVQDGILHLKAFKQNHTGPTYPLSMGEVSDGTTSQEYTSGKVTTQGLAAYKYGRFSARLKLPAGQGTWPAFWMMPETNAYGSWPLSGEIDILEATNLKTPCDECPNGVEYRTSGALHFGGLIPDNTFLYLKTGGDAKVSPSDEWRVYAVEWAEGVIQWMVDGKVFMRLHSDDWSTQSELAKGRPFAPFDQPFHMILNMAVGGNLAERQNGAGFDPKSFPAELQVDWVRVEQCTNDLETGLACMSKQDWEGEPQGPWDVQAR